MAYTSFENEEKKEIVDASEREGKRRINSTALAFCEFSPVLPLFLSTFSFLDD